MGEMRYFGNHPSSEDSISELRRILKENKRTDIFHSSPDLSEDPVFKFSVSRAFKLIAHIYVSFLD